MGGDFGFTAKAGEEEEDGEGNRAAVVLGLVRRRPATCRVAGGGARWRAPSWERQHPGGVWPARLLCPGTEFERGGERELWRELERGRLFLN